MDKVNLTGQHVVSDKTHACALCSLNIDAGIQHNVVAIPDKNWEQYTTLHVHDLCGGIYAWHYRTKRIVFELSDSDVQSKFLALIRDRLYEFYDNNYIAAHMESGVFDGGIMAEIQLVHEKLIVQLQSTTLAAVYLKGNNRRLGLELIESNGNQYVRVYGKRLVNFEKRIISDYDLKLTLETFVLLSENSEFFLNNNTIYNHISDEMKEIRKVHGYIRFVYIK